MPLVAFLTFASLAVAWVYGLGTPDHLNAVRPFNSGQWKAADSYGKARCGMVADLRYRVGLIGKSRAEIALLLGGREDADDDLEFTRYHLCPSFLDVYILELRWKKDRVVSIDVRDT